MDEDVPSILKSKTKINSVVAKKIRDSYIEALDESLSANFENLKETASPYNIKNDWGIDYTTQVKFGISLSKRKAIIFLEECGYEISLPMIRKKLSEEKYLEKFKRPISKIGTSHVFTYGEVLILMEHKMRP